jgi:hypothetical protein
MVELLHQLIIKLRQNAIENIFAYRIMKRLTGWEDVKQHTNVIVGPVYIFLTNMKFGINRAPWIQIICKVRSKSTQNRKLMCHVICSSNIWHTTKSLSDP